MSMDVRESFLNFFQLMTPKQQKIWKSIQWYAKNFRHVFPSHAKIAEFAGCCRDTVIAALKKFSELGWIGFIKRCFRSNLYFMNEELIDLNLDDPMTFKRPIPTREPTPIPSGNPTVLFESKNKEIERNVRNESENVHHIEKKKQELSHEVKQLPLSDRDKHLLARYSPQILRLAIEDWKSYALLKHVRNVAAFLESRARYYYDQFKMKVNNSGNQQKAQSSTA